MYHTGTFPVFSFISCGKLVQLKSVLLLEFQDMGSKPGRCHSSFVHSEFHKSHCSDIVVFPTTLPCNNLITVFAPLKLDHIALYELDYFSLLLFLLLVIVVLVRVCKGYCKSLFSLHLYCCILISHFQIFPVLY